MFALRDFGIAAVTVAMAMAGALFVQDSSVAQTATPVLAEVQKALVRVEVVAIDTMARVITVRGPDGLFDVAVDDSIKRLDGIRTGDLLTVAYRHAVAVDISSGTGIHGRSTAEVSRPTPGERPAGSGAIEETIVADIVQVDAARSLILVRGVMGKVAWLSLPDSTVLARLKPGDQVTIRYQLAVGLAFEPAAR